MRWLWALPALLLGVALGVSAVAVHRQMVWFGEWYLPWGAVLAVAAPAAVGLALRRYPAALLGYLLGWMSTVLGALVEGPGGDFLLMSDLVGWGFLGATVLLVVVVLVTGATAQRRGEGANRR